MPAVLPGVCGDEEEYLFLPGRKSVFWGRADDNRSWALWEAT